MTEQQFEPAWYTGMPEGNQIPAPQLIKDAWILIVGYEADPEVLESALPPGLDPHPSNLVHLNMYQVPSSDQTTHLAPYSLTYLAVEVEGHDSRTISSAEGEISVPGRFYVRFWNDSPEMQTYLREAGGTPVQAGSCSWDQEDGELDSTLSVDGDTVIETKVSVGNEQIDTFTGHLNYYAHKQIPDPAGSRAQINELIEFPIPFVSEVYDADVEHVEFDFPDGSRAQEFAPTNPHSISSEEVFYGIVTFTYPQGRRIRDYLADNDG